MFKYVFLCILLITLTISVSAHTTRVTLFKDDNEIACDCGNGNIEYLRRNENITFVVGYGEDAPIKCITQIWCYQGDDGVFNKHFDCNHRTKNIDVVNVTDKKRHGTWNCGFKIRSNIIGTDNEFDIPCNVEYRLVPSTPSATDDTLPKPIINFTAGDSVHINGSPETISSPTNTKLPALNIFGRNIHITQDGRIKTYKLEFTYGKTGFYDVNMTCGLDDVNNYNYNLEFYAVNDRNKNEHDQKTTKRGVSSVTRMFRLTEQHKKIICVATHKNSSPNIQNIVFLTYIPQPSLTITEPKLKEHYSEIEGRRDYSLDFTDNSQLSLQCRLEYDERIRVDYRVQYLYQKSVHKDIQETQQSVKGGLLRSLGPIKLDKDYDEYIMCLAENNDDNSLFPKSLSSIIHLTYSPAPRLKITGSGLEAGPNDKKAVPVYTLKYTNKEKLYLRCILENRTEYNVHFVIYPKRSPFYSLNGTPDVISNGVSITLIIDNAFDYDKVLCVADNIDETSIFPKTLSSQVHLIYQPPSGIHLKVNWFAEETCRPVKEKKVSTTCDYTYGDKEIGRIFSLTCFYKEGSSESNKLIFKEDGETNVDKTVKRGEEIKTDIKLTDNNKTVSCFVVDETDNDYVPIATYEIHFIYRHASTSQSSGESTKPTQDPNSSEGQDINQNKPKIPWWFVVAGVSVILILLIIVAMLVFCRKKSPPKDQNYENVTDQQVKYQTKPVAAPRTLTKPMNHRDKETATKPVDQKPNIAPKLTVKPKAVLECTYSDPKDSADMSEALYADPNRLINESDTYALPYVKSDTYSEPYVAGSDYAELYQDRDLYATPDKSQNKSDQVDLYATVGNKATGKDLYATPVPKALRKPVVKDDEYSNIFKGLYGNTKR